MDNRQNGANINWYPGHMAKAKSEIEKSLKLIDIVIEILDARIPKSSKNPMIDKMLESKEKIVVLNKSDLADKDELIKWKKYYEQDGSTCITTNANISENISKIIDAINIVGKKIYDKKYENKTIEINHIYRCMIVGIPNVGKSTIINKIANRQAVQIGNKPGVTKKNQWIRFGKNIELLDTPGLLWPKFEDMSVGIKLALFGNIKEEILDTQELACNGIEMLISVPKYKKLLIDKYKLDNNLEIESYEILEMIGKKRGCLIKGGNVDMQKASKIFIDDMKNGKIGNITLDLI